MNKNMFFLELCLTIILIYVSCNCDGNNIDNSHYEQDESETTLPRIGIIGGGLSGTSAAYFLRDLFGDGAVIDVYEASKIGGRTALININGQNYEAGGSIIHKNNRYMVNFCQLFNLGQIDKSGGKLGLYNNDGIVFETSDYMAVTLAKLAWRYGLDLYTIRNWITDDLFKKFNRIYDFQDAGMSFTSVEDLLGAMGPEIVNMTRHSIKDVLLDAGLSERFVDELAMGAMRNNYGQTTAVHGFVGAVSMAGVEPGLWAVEKGNKGVAEAFLANSKANLLKNVVKSVTLFKDELGTSYEVEYQHGDSTNAREYDIVIIATPLEAAKNKLVFQDFPTDIAPFSQPFHTTVAMFVEGRVNSSSFGVADTEDFPPDLLTVSDNVFFNSIGKLSPVDSDSKPDKPLSRNHAIWKTFLNKVPTEEQIKSLFDDYEDLRLVNWQAYPEYKPGMDLPPFILYDRLYYVNAIESAASAMEMSVIGAKNVANLAFNQWHGNFDKIDEFNLPSQSTEAGAKSEL